MKKNSKKGSPMLEQYRQDYSADSDALSESRFQTSRRKLVFTLAGAAVALLLFLFLIGAFQGDDHPKNEQIAAQDAPEAVGEPASPRTIEAQIQELQARLDRLEKLLAPTA